MKSTNIARVIIVSVFLALVATDPALAQGDAAAGESKFFNCKGCHGVPGYTNVYPNYHVPRLGGQKPMYITTALQAYRGGTRPHPTMQANAWDLTDQDIADIAAFLGDYGPPGEQPVVTGNVAAGQAKSETCVACHGEDGKGIAPNFPVIAGQYEDYLRHALTQYREGDRQQALMNGIAGELSDQDIADLAAYYASKNGNLAVIIPRN